MRELSNNKSAGTIHRRVRSLSCLLAALILALVGCSRDSTESAASAPAQDAPAETPAAPVPDAAPDATSAAASPETAPAAPLAGAPTPQPQIEGAVHLFMTSQLRRYIEEHGRMPSSFAEFASARMDSVPFAPDGMEYVIDEQRREVKVVKKKR